MRLRWRERCWWCTTLTRKSAYFGKCRGIVPVVQVRLRWDKLLRSRRAEAGVMGQPCPRTLPDMRQAYTSGGRVLNVEMATFRWCPSIACIKERRSAIDRSLVELG